MTRKAFSALVGVGVVALGAFVLLSRPNSLKLDDPMAAQASRSSSKPTESRARSSLTYRAPPAATSFPPTAGKVEATEPAGPTKAPGAELLLAASPSEAAGDAKPSARDQVLQVLDKIDEQFQDPEIRAAFARERAKVMANLSE